MSSRGRVVFGLTRVALVRHGAEVKLPKGEHRGPRVYAEMLLQITRDYAGLPDPRTLSAHEIRFFYDGLRYELMEATKPRGK